MRPVLKPALRRLWRGPSTVQIGLDPDRAVVLSGCGADIARVLDALDGGHDPEHPDAGREPASPRRYLVDLLHRARLIDDANVSTSPIPGLDPVHRERLAPDLASLSLATGAADGGVGLLRRRREAVISVYGAGRVGAAVASLLAAAGVGTVGVVDARTCRPADCTPVGLPLRHLGRRRDHAVSELLRGYATGAEPDTPPLAVVLTGEATTDPRIRGTLMRGRVPHVVATVRETTGVVGTFVLPGQSACLRCQDLHRADRDPGWPLVAAQLAAGSRSPVEACDTVLATSVACWVSREVLTFLDGTARPQTVNGSLELSLSEWRWRRRSWTPHPTCGCCG
jgi:hypothetical protein